MFLLKKKIYYVIFRIQLPEKIVSKKKRLLEKRKIPFQKFNDTYIKTCDYTIKSEYVPAKIKNKFIYMFSSGVIAIRHWNVNNQIRKDRYNETFRIDEKKLLKLENNVYELKDNSGIPNDIPTVTTVKYSIDKNSIDKLRVDKISKENEIFVSGLVLPQVSTSTGQAGDVPQAHIASTQLDLGRMAGLKSLKGKLKLENKGKAPLQIRALQVYNSGMRVKIGSRTIAPGKSKNIEVTVMAETGRTFKGRRSVLLLTNDPVQPKIVIDVLVKK